MRIMAVWLFAWLVALFTAAAMNDGPTPVSFVVRDNVTIFADDYGDRGCRTAACPALPSSRVEPRGIRPDRPDADYARLRRARHRSTLWRIALGARKRDRAASRPQCRFGAALHELRQAALVWAKSSVSLRTGHRLGQQLFRRARFLPRRQTSAGREGASGILARRIPRRCVERAKRCGAAFNSGSS